MRGGWGFIVAVGLVVAACSPDRTTDTNLSPSSTVGGVLTEYAHASEIAEAMATAGFGCGDAEAVPLVVVEAGTSDIGCASPIATDMLFVEVHQSERHRLWRVLDFALGFKCKVGDWSETPPYVYGESWWVHWADAATDEELAELAEALGGKVNTAACAQSWLDQRSGTVSIDSVTVEELRSVLEE